MRLLHTALLTFEDFYETSLPKYAILSHRWGEMEVSFKDLLKGRAQEGQGLAKIKGACKLAATQRYDWIWIDTCCIDKKSSAELSEAINSMYRWYSNAAECYALLSDVTSSQPQDIQSSCWFSRGWTLQELLAPGDVIFYNADWQIIGRKHQLKSEISAATGIHRDYLGFRRNPVEEACVATKMYWASCRQTSRPEDLAYCLLGIFDVNMPLLYGEGARKAFLRLQTEILNKSTDETIFAWTGNQHRSGLLASSPLNFAYSGEVRRSKGKRAAWMISNHGLQFILSPREWAFIRHNNIITGIITKLNCYFGYDTKHAHAVVVGLEPLERSPLAREHDTWMRVDCGGLQTNPTIEGLIANEKQGSMNICINLSLPVN